MQLKQWLNENHISKNLIKITAWQDLLMSSEYLNEIRYMGTRRGKDQTGSELIISKLVGSPCLLSFYKQIHT